jgi:DNA helicase-4
MLTDYLVLQLAMLGDDSFADAEESRLFHVALNRVKTSVTLISLSHKESPFL